MESNKNKIFAVIAIGVMLLLLIGSTFAYFAAQGGNASQTDVNVLTHTVDSLVFETGDALSITADQTSFAQGKGNQTDSTFARATLKANSSTNQATDHYYVYLSIDENNFEYTTTEKTAELILTINKVEGETKTPVTTIDGLNYVTVGSVSGFDITEVNNLITIANNYEITSTGTKIDEWEVILTLVNLDSNQNNNTGKSFNGTLLIQKEMVASQYITSLFTTQGANNLYRHDGTIKDAEGNVLDAEDGSYRYAGGDYKVAPAYQEIYKNITGSSDQEVAPVIGFVCDGEESYVGASCVGGKTYYYYLYYDTNESKTQYATFKEALNKAITDGYVEKHEVKNFVCFGDDCTDEDNLYRVIGVFNGKMKLIKADYAGVNLLGTNGDAIGEAVSTSDMYIGTKSSLNYYYWNKANLTATKAETGAYNVWSYSELNKINLNTNYLTNIGSKWSNMINEMIWYIGGTSSISLNDWIRTNAKFVYNNEIGSLKNADSPFLPHNAKVGLMYISDYVYATSPDNWNTGGVTYYKNIVRDNNWLFLGNSEWTISTIDKPNYYTPRAQNIRKDGRLFNGSSVTSGTNAVRPTFYLKSSVTFAGGSGTANDPYRIA